MSILGVTVVAYGYEYVNDDVDSLLESWIMYPFGSKILDNLGWTDGIKKDKYPVPLQFSIIELVDPIYFEQIPINAPICAIWSESTKKLGLIDTVPNPPKNGLTNWIMSDVLEVADEFVAVTAFNVKLIVDME